MKYLLNLSINIAGNLDTENLRGEGRWEYNTLNALVTHGGTGVHTTRNCCMPGFERPESLYDGMNEEWLDESILLVHSAGRSLFIETDKAKAYAIQVFEPHSGQAKEDFLNYLKQDRIVATTASLNPWIYNQLTVAYGAENVYHMAGAMVPYVDDEVDNFRKPNVTWAYRNFHTFAEEHPDDMAVLLGYLEQCLVNEPEMRIAILIGLWPTDRFTTHPDKQKVRDWVLSFPVMQRFKHLWPRIDTHINLHWNEVLSLFSETRYVISPGGPLGGAPFEAAMFGIPTIVSQQANAFMTLESGKLFPELLTAPIAIQGAFIQTIDRLQNDHEFYRTTGNAYRTYVKNNATFEAYAKQMNKITTERGWNV